MTFTTRTPPRPRAAPWIAAGFVAGAASVLIFHQGAFALLNALGLTERAPWSMVPTEPFGLPRLASIALWGGAWGAAFALMFRNLDGLRLVAASLAAGAVLPTLVAWLVVAPLQGQPVAAGLDPLAMAFSVLVNGAWGLGTGLGLALLGRDRRKHDRRHISDRRHDDGDRRRGLFTAA